jgi:hypothetical protein
MLTIDAAKEVWVESQLVECIDRLDALGLLNLDQLFGLLLLGLDHAVGLRNGVI